MHADFQAIISQSEEKGLNYRQLAGKTVLITGATGLIGTYLVKFLLHLNENILATPVDIVCLVRSSLKAFRRFNLAENNKNLSLIVKYPGQVIETGSYDYIFHLASKASSDCFAQNPLDVFDANVSGTRQMLDLARATGAKMLFVSSGEVYGQGALTPTPETGFGYIDLADIRSCYAESKRAAEVFCVCAAKEWGVDVRIARLFHSYGPGLDLQNDPRIFAELVKSVVCGKNVMLRGAGLAIRSFLYLQDLLEGFFTILFKGNSGEAYNVGGTPVTISGLAETLCKLYPEKNLRVIYNAEFSDSYLPSPIDKNIPDNAKLESLGWKQTVSLVEGFKRTIAYHEEFYT